MAFHVISIKLIGSTKAAILIVEAERKAARQSGLKETKGELQSPHDQFQQDLADMTVNIEKAKSDAKSEAAQKHQDHLVPFQIKEIQEVQEEGKWVRRFGGQAGQGLDKIIGTASNQGYWHDVGEIFIGYYNAGENIVTGIYTIFRHPIQTTKGLYHAVTHPVETAKVLYKEVVEKWKTNRGKGEIIGDIILIFATGPASKAAKEAGHFAKLSNAVGAAKNRVANVARTIKSKVAPRGTANDLAILNLQTNNHVTSLSTKALNIHRGEVILQKNQFAILKNGETLTIVGHGTPTSVAGMSAKELADLLAKSRLSPARIELCSCKTGTAKFAQELAERTGVPVSAPRGNINVIEDIVGVPQVRDPITGILRAPGELIETFYPLSFETIVGLGF